MARLFSWCGVAVLALIASISPLHARTFTASAVEAQATVADGLAQVSFKVAITNDSSSPMTNVVIVFADNTEITVGDIGGDTTVTTEQQSRTIELGESSTRSLTIPVTVKYSVDGENVETAWVLAVFAE